MNNITFEKRNQIDGGKPLSIKVTSEKVWFRRIIDGTIEPAFMILDSSEIKNIAELIKVIGG